jgi:glycerate dehydrogenase
MKLVVLDGFTTNPGDLEWRALEALGELTVYDRTPEDKILERSAGAEVLLTNKTPLTRGTIAALPALRFVSVLATGYNVVDLAAARERGIPVSNAPAYSTRSVQQMTFALLLELTQQCGAHDRAVKEGAWCRCKDSTFQLRPLLELDGLTFGVLGFGAIGRAVAQVARAFGMKVIASGRDARDQRSEVGGQKAEAGGRILTSDLRSLTFVERVTREELFRRSDVLSLHCPLTPETANVVNGETLALMKPTALLINTGRGGLVDEAELARALNEGRIAGAGVDVLSSEPPPPDNPLLHARNIVITPHCAWATRAARQRLLDITVANVQAFQAGCPVNVVNEF